MSSLSLSSAPPALGPGPGAAVVDVSVVIVTYNVRGFLDQALRSVERASAGLAVETFVVDNDSADGSAEMVRERFPDVRLIANEENVGFAVANNQALREAAGRYALVLNPDTILQEDTLRTLVAFMDGHPDAGAVGCRILNPDGTFAPESRRAFPTPAVAFYRIAGLARLFPQSPRFGRYNLTHLPADEVCEVDALSGSCMMVRREAMWGGGEGHGMERDEEGWAEKSAPHGSAHPPMPPSLHPSPRGAGLLDEAFFMYGEDLDWCYRIQRAGWRIYYTPETQIVHYKGESTKRGDLRYVVLFYGAMLRFVEKHVGGGAGWAERAGTGALALALRVGIVGRAAVAALGRLGRGLAGPAADGALAWAALAAAAWGWSQADGFAFGSGFYGLVLPAYALALVGGVALAGGYPRGRPPLRPVAVGAALAALAVAAASFFVPSIAFSRAALGLGFPAAAALLLARRVRRRTRTAPPRRALVVGTAAEAERLRRLLGGRLRPEAEVVGYVAEAGGDGTSAAGGAVPHVGRPRQLRDLARLQHADEVVFAADSLTNTAILEGMRALRDLPVQLKILASGHDRIIGKAYVEDYAAPLLEAERAVAPLRAGWSRRALEVPVAALFTLAAPALRATARLRPTARWRRLAAFAARMPSVLAGRRALVGYDAAGPHPPPAWGLPPGVVSVLDTRRPRPATITEAHRAYWFYAQRQSPWLDAEILLRALLHG
ncbi:glycosyltransferase family 2 protein [Rubrivirga sp. S365]|uniref:glycosyltransferase family 2 protein n=1 Tax=Rubrivirga sp. S365 TaxID=3076080 RepID=UPI0028CA80A9|nr:glycosyltransferase family 2 protein [Rubrivirga sp. S365]MDT7855937.1 glycosyltransferase family 2 protein [Rubrivirga sp. S365]